MADYNSKYSGEQIEQLLQQAGGGSTVTEQTVSGWGFTKNQGTVTGVKINGSTKNPSNGVVDLGTVITDISGKQDKLVSGTNIKTINGTSILGSGDIAISGGGSSDKVEVVQVQPEIIDGDVWLYHIPAGKFVELRLISGAIPSYILFEMSDPVEYTLEDEYDWVPEYSKYHFTMPWTEGLSFGFSTNLDPNFTATPIIYDDGPWAIDAVLIEFDVLSAFVHYPASTGFPNVLVLNIAKASLYRL